MRFLKKNSVLYFIVIVLFSCEKPDLRWNLERVAKSPQVELIQILDISNSGCTIESRVIFNGGAAVEARGVCWSTAENPTLEDEHTVDGSGSDLFSSSLNGLTANTTYYVRSYATNSSGTAYSIQFEFITTNVIGSLPEVTTSPVSSISSTSAVTGGSVLSDGGSPVTQRGICWSTSSSPTFADNSSSSGSGIGNFSSTITTLESNTTYYVRAFATNGVGTSYGNQISFTTTSNLSLPVVTTNAAIDITLTSATSGGNVASDGGSPVTQRGICWSTSSSPTLVNESVISGSGLGAFTSVMSTLAPSTVYYVRSFATNSVGTSYGNQISFNTSTPVAALSEFIDCTSLVGVSSLYYGMNGTSTTWGLSTGGYNGSCWIAPNPNYSGQLGTVVGANHYVEFSHVFTNSGYVEFWVNTYNPGNNNLVPVIAVDGVAIGNATIIDGQASSFYWMKVRSPEISAGSNNVKILLSGSYFILKLDEIAVYEY